MRKLRWLAAALIVTSSFLFPSIAGAAPDPVYTALRAARPDGRRIPVQNLVLERDAFRFQLDSGEIHLLKPVEGRTIGGVFRALVPLQVEFGKNEVATVGLLPMKGAMTLPVNVQVKLPKKPRKALVNAHGEVLARE